MFLFNDFWNKFVVEILKEEEDPTRGHLRLSEIFFGNEKLLILPEEQIVVDVDRVNYFRDKNKAVFFFISRERQRLHLIFTHKKGVTAGDIEEFIVTILKMLWPIENGMKNLNALKNIVH